MLDETRTRRRSALMGRRGALRVIAGLLSATALGARVPSAFAEQSFVLIVHPQNSISSASREFLADVFLKKTTRWENGETIRPADLGPRSAVRNRFSEAILKRSVETVRRYWQQRIFSGRDLPPPEFASEDALVDYVLTHRGAVGYVSSHTQLRGAKVIAVK